MKTFDWKCLKRRQKRGKERKEKGDRRIGKRKRRESKVKYCKGRDNWEKKEKRK